MGMLAGGFSHGASGISLVVNATANGDSNTSIAPQGCAVGVAFNADVEEYLSTPAGDFTDYVGEWLTVGSSSDVWVMFTRTSGDVISWDTLASDTTYQLTSDREFRFIVGPEQTGTMSGYFRFYDNAGGTGTPLQTTSTVAWIATSESGAQKFTGKINKYNKVISLKSFIGESNESSNKYQ